MHRNNPEAIYQFEFEYFQSNAAREIIRGEQGPADQGRSGSAADQGQPINSTMLQGPGKYWIRAAALGKDKDSSATALGAYSGWVEFNALNVELDIANTAAEPDDVVCVNGTVNVKARLIGPAGVNATVNFSVNPSARATIDPTSTNMTVGTDYDLTLTGQQASDAVNDTDLIAKIGTCQIDCETENFTVCKVEIKDGEDETKDPGKFVCVGNGNDRCEWDSRSRIHSHHATRR